MGAAKDGGGREEGREREPCRFVGEIFRALECLYEAQHLF